MDESCGSEVAGPSTTSTLSYCCLVDSHKRCMRLASSHYLNKRVERAIATKRLKLEVDPVAPHSQICVYHYKLACPSVQKQKMKIKKETDSESESKPHVPKIKLNLVSASSFRRIKKFVRAPPLSGPNKPSKKELADSVSECLQDIPVNEKEIITYFIYTVKTDKNKMDSKV